jgi:hypothetical protein
MQDAVLRAFLVVQDELHGDAGAAGPVRMRRVATVSHEVAGIAVGGGSRGHGGNGTAPQHTMRRRR